LKKGEVNLPKLPESKAKQLLAENLDQILEFKEESGNDNSGSRTEKKKKHDS